jgi:hypothetical protein
LPQGWKTSIGPYLSVFVERFCAAEDLATYDPYDIWMTPLGFAVKNFYNRWPVAGLPPAALLSVFDNFFNNDRRWFYVRREYPIVRAMAAQCLVNLFRENGDARLLDFAERHLEWLVANSCTGYSGPCWGLGFRYPVTADIFYGPNTPLSTMTPYALEAFLAWREALCKTRFDSVIRGILEFLDRDLCMIEEDDEGMATSYGPWRDRVVINAVTYTLYAYSLLLPFAARQRILGIRRKIGKLCRYVLRQQRPDGSWLYSPHGRSFIDCFHTCIVLKNLVKADRAVRLPDSEAAVRAGYLYLKKAFLDEREFLFRRFSLRSKPGIVRFDLYDNAEALNLALLLGDFDLANRLLPRVLERFVDGLDIHSQIDVAGIRRNKNTLRWAVMPLLCAMSQRIGRLAAPAN